MNRDYYIVIVGCAFSFPNGHGASARISQYAKGLVEQGRSVKILCLKPTESPNSPILNPNEKGEYYGATYEYTSGTTICSKNKITRYLQNLKGVVGTFRAVHRLQKESQIHTVLYYGTDSPFYTVVLWLLAKINGAFFVGENTEAPFVYSKAGLTTLFKKWLVTRLTHKLFDGFIVISTSLEKTFRLTLRRNTPILRLPVMVDTSVFASVKHESVSLSRYIIYCGNLNHEGEVDGLLKTWSLLKNEFPNWKIRIIGDNSSSDIREPILNRINELDIRNSIEFTGLVPREQLIELLLCGDVMVLPRASGLFSEAGLPNKLGEYLASGKPVVTTNIGDIELYLQDRIDAYLVPPDDFQAFTDTLRYVLCHPNEAEIVGKNGLAAAQKYFDTHINCKRLINFIQL